MKLVVIFHFYFIFFFLMRLVRKQFCLLWLPQAVDFKVSCSQIPRRAFAGIRTHDPLVDRESDVLTIRPRRSTFICSASDFSLLVQVLFMNFNIFFNNKTNISIRKLVLRRKTSSYLDLLGKSQCN
jgi:hypothetical protein